MSDQPVFGWALYNQPIKECRSCRPAWWVRLLSPASTLHGKDHPTEAHRDYICDYADAEMYCVLPNGHRGRHGGYEHWDGG